jgi:nucleoside-diphosphate-sugar epimerase
MRVLVIGGSGRVGSIVLPFLAEKHSLRVFDLHPPIEGDWEYVEGNAGDSNALRQALSGMDAVIYMAMGALKWRTDEGVVSAFDVNVRNVYLTLRAASEAGIGHAVYTSSMSVYRNIRERYFESEDIPPDETGLYGLTKRMGEECCRAAVDRWEMTVNALRLCFPKSEEEWQAETNPFQAMIGTAAPDLARALEASLLFRDGYQAFMISGDYEHRVMNMEKAKRLLGWEPLARRAPVQSD